MTTEPLDADFAETDGVHDIRTLLPCMTINFETLAKDLAFYGGPLDFRCERDPQSNTGVRFTIAFTDVIQESHVVTSKYFRKLLLQVAAIERKAHEERQRRRGSGGKKKKGGLVELPLFPGG
jgi:hypothetical protein